MCFASAVDSGSAHTGGSGVWLIWGEDYSNQCSPCEGTDVSIALLSQLPGA